MEQGRIDTERSDVKQTLGLPSHKITNLCQNIYFLSNKKPTTKQRIEKQTQRLSTDDSMAIARQSVTRCALRVQQGEGMSSSCGVEIRRATFHVLRPSVEP